MSRKVATVLANVNKAPLDVEEGLVIGHLIGRLRTVALSALDSELQAFGFTGMQFLIMKHVFDGTCETAADLCRLMHYDTGSMTRLLDRMEEKGWMRRERRADDRRVVRLCVTSAGRAALPRLRDSAAHVIQRMLSGFSAAEVKDLRSFLNRMIENG